MRKLHLEQLESRRVFDVSTSAMPDFALLDANSASATYTQSISPTAFSGKVSAWYFAHATCGYCTAQFGHLNTLLAELKAEYPQLEIEILGVNQTGSESGNAQITAGKTLPWLQDVDANQNGQSDVWTEKWDVEFRDVVILNGAGEKIDVYNLTSHNLATTENFDELKEKLIDAALESQLPWHNAAKPHDVDQDNSVAPIDALLVLVELNQRGSRRLEAPQGTTPLQYLYDIDGDGVIAPLDAMLVIIELNQISSLANAPQGEAPAEDFSPAPLASQDTSASTLFDILALDQLLDSDRRKQNCG